jgi:hypothetical protein
MENRGRQKDRGKGSGNHENSRKGRSKSRLGKIECWNCGKKGHLKKDCVTAKSILIIIDILSIGSIPIVD